MTTIRYRPLAFGVTRAVLREGAPGTQYLRAETELGPYRDRMTDRLAHWAEAAPERSSVDRRDAGIAFLAAVHGLSSLVLAGRIRLRDTHLHGYVQKTIGPVVDGVLTGLISG